MELNEQQASNLPAAQAQGKGACSSERLDPGANSTWPASPSPGRLQESGEGVIQRLHDFVDGCIGLLASFEGLMLHVLLPQLQTGPCRLLSVSDPVVRHEQVH